MQGLGQHLGFAQKGLQPRFPQRSVRSGAGPQLPAVGTLRDARRGELLDHDDEDPLVACSFEARVCPWSLASICALFDYDEGVIAVVEEAQFRGLNVRFDRDDAIIRNFQARGLAVDRHSFGVRTDDQVLGWRLLRAGAGLGFAQVKLAETAPELERLLPDLPLPSLPVWLVMHEEVRANARIRRVADALSDGLRAFLTR